jgi:Exocyst complex component Sec10
MIYFSLSWDLDYILFSLNISKSSLLTLLVDLSLQSIVLSRIMVNDRDMALYHNTIESWRISSLAEPFELLREIGNMFIVK